ncbi:MAG: glutathione S-transferase [Rhodobacteraceae bacterium]|nr:MAG: glutathione S-transferase [Paracoccaceae bacterium]
MTDYTLYYWPIPFRGHFIRYVLAAAEATWDEPATDALTALKSRAPGDQPYPFMAPPLLVDHETGRSLSQMPAILMSLARAHELVVDPDRDLRLICDASDVLFEITRHHGAALWDAESWADFAATRLPRWMQVHEALVRASGAGFLDGGDEPMLGDLVLAALWHTMTDRLPPLDPLLETHAPATRALALRVAERPALAAMRAGWADRHPLYCGGRIEASLCEVLGM